MKKALVTGANGFLGAYLTSELLKKGVDVIAAGHNGNYENIPEQARPVSLDIKDFSALKKLIPDKDIDVIFHLAWDGGSGQKRADYSLQLDNAKYTCDAVKTASEMGIKRFVGIGSIAQYNCSVFLGDNDMRSDPVICYAAAKNAAQTMGKAVADSVGVEFVWCFVSNIYGEGDHTTNFINRVSGMMLNGERVAFTSGEQSYDFVHVADTINGIYLCGEKGLSDHSYYIGSGKPRKLKEFIEVIRDTIDPKIPLYLGEIPFSGKSVPMEWFDCSKLTDDTGYMPEISFEEGIKRTVMWLRERQKDT